MRRLKTINKYPNWQLYDIDNNQRVTLNDIRRMIVAGIELRIMDEDSGDDVTVASLIHIIVDRECDHQSLSSDVLIA